MKKLFKRIVSFNEGFAGILLACLVILTAQHCGKKDPAPEFTATVSTFAGSTFGYNDGKGTNAQFYTPSGIAVDASGNVYVAHAFVGVLHQQTHIRRDR